MEIAARTCVIVDVLDVCEDYVNLWCNRALVLAIEAWCCTSTPPSSFMCYSSVPPELLYIKRSKRGGPE